MPTAQNPQDLFPTLMDVLRRNDGATLDALLDPSFALAGPMEVLLRATNVNGQTPLMYAAHQRRPAMVERLLAHDPSQALTVRPDGHALIWAANGGCADCVRLLLPFSDAAVRDANGYNALMRTVEHGHAAAFAVLIADAAPEHARATTRVERHTALMIAGMRGQATFLDPLLAISDARAVDLDGFNALHLAADRDRPACVLALLDRDPLLAATRTSGGQTAFALLVEQADLHTDHAFRQEALDRLALLEPDQELVARTVQRHGVERYPRWAVEHERRALHAALDEEPDRPAASYDERPAPQDSDDRRRFPLRSTPRSRL